MKKDSATFYKSKEWKELRYKFLRVAEKKCMNTSCKNEVGPFYINHKKSRAEYPKLALNINNLQLLCEKCHPN